MPTNKPLQLPRAALKPKKPVALQVTNHMNREAIHQMTGLPDRAVVFVRFEGEARNKQCLPYFIAVDERSKAVGELQHAACSRHEYPTSIGQILVSIFCWQQCP